MPIHSVPSSLKAAGFAGLKAAQIPPEAKKGAKKVESAFAKDETTLKGMGFAGP